MKVYFYQCKPQDPRPYFSWLIMLAQGMNPFRRSSYSHLAIGYVSITGNLKVADCSTYGVADKIKEKFNQKNKFVNEIELDVPISRKQFLLWLEEQEGKPYAIRQLGGMLLKVFGLISFNKIGKNWKALVCSELILSFLHTFYKLPVKDPDNWDMVSTWKIVEEIKGGSYGSIS